MKNVLKVNWNKLSKLSDKTLNAYQLFEDGRKSYLDIIKSLDECWEGKDADIFIGNAVEFLESLEEESNYLKDLGNCYNQSSKKYHIVVEEHYDELKRKNDILELDDNKGDL